MHPIQGSHIDDVSNDTYDIANTSTRMTVKFSPPSTIFAMLQAGEPTLTLKS